MRQFVKSVAVLSIVLAAVLVGGVGFAAADTQQPAGNGTVDDPYQITNWHELAYMNESQSFYFVQQNDLNSSTNGYSEHVSNPTNGWDPIGNSASKFTGVFDGDDHIIDGVTIDRGSTQYVGLFGSTEGSTLKNIRLTNVDINGSDNTGPIAGAINVDSRINNSYVTGDIEGANYAGGVVGTNYQSSINNSYSIANIEADNIVGGIAGDNDGGYISDSYSTGAVSGTNVVGGIAGENNGGYISDSYSTGAVSGSSDVGGLVGGIAGNTIDSYWDINSTNQTTSSGGTGLTTSEMQGSSAATNMDFDFTTDWETVESSDSDATNDGYPVLQNNDREAQLLAQSDTDPISEYFLNIETSNSTTYSVTDVDGVEVASGQTEAGGAESLSLESGDYTVTVAGGDSDYDSISRSVTLDSDTTESFTLSASTYNLIINTLDNNQNNIDTDYTVKQDGSVVDTGQTTTGNATVHLQSGDYTLTVADNDERYDGVLRTLTFNNQENISFGLSKETYDLSFSVVDNSGNNLDTDYKIENSTGTIANGTTGPDGEVVQTLPYGDYNVTVADSDQRYNSQYSSITVDSYTIEGFNPTPKNYDLTIQTEDSNGNAIDTTYSVLDDSGTEVVSGSTGSDGSVVETLEYGDYDVRTSATDSTYDQKSRSLTLDSDKTETFNPSKSSYTITIGASDDLEGIATDYEVLDSNGNVVSSGTTDPNSTVTETLSAGDYTVEYANGDREVYSTTESVVLDSDQTVEPTLEPIDLSVSVDSGTIYEGVETTFDADVSNRQDSNYSFDWYVNNNSVAAGSDDTFTYTFEDNGQFKIRVETQIDGNEYIATRPLPEQAWVPAVEEDGSEWKVEFTDIEINTVDSNGSVIADHIVNANLRRNLTDREPLEEEIRKKATTSNWQVIATNDVFIKADSDEYGIKYARVSESTLKAYEGLEITVGFGQAGSENTSETFDNRPEEFGYVLGIQNTTIIDTDGDSNTDEDGFFGDGDSSGPGGGGNAVGLLLLGVLSAAVLLLVGGISLLSLIPGVGGGEGAFGGEDRIPNPLRWLGGDD